MTATRTRSLGAARPQRPRARVSPAAPAPINVRRSHFLYMMTPSPGQSKRDVSQSLSLWNGIIARTWSAGIRRELISTSLGAPDFGRRFLTRTPRAGTVHFVSCSRRADLFPAKMAPPCDYACVGFFYALTCLTTGHSRSFHSGCWHTGGNDGRTEGPHELRRRADTGLTFPDNFTYLDMKLST